MSSTLLSVAVQARNVSSFPSDYKSQIYSSIYITHRKCYYGCKMFFSNLLQLGCFDNDMTHMNALKLPIKFSPRVFVPRWPKSYW